MLTIKVNNKHQIATTTRGVFLLHNTHDMVISEITKGDAIKVAWWILKQAASLPYSKQRPFLPLTND